MFFNDFANFGYNATFPKKKERKRNTRKGEAEQSYRTLKRGGSWANKQVGIVFGLTSRIVNFDSSGVSET
jgi:hypothetical protein